MSFHEIIQLLCFLYLLGESRALNVALGKSAKFCDSRPASDLLTDGDKNFKNSVSFGESCLNSAHSSLTIYLEQQYTIEYVIVFQGIDNSEKQLNHFSVLVGNEGQADMTVCSEYPFTRGPLVEGMRVNCRPNGNIYSQVQLKSRYNKGMDIAELEVYTLGLSSTRNILIHRGCFQMFGGSTRKFGLLRCQAICLNEGFIFAGIKGKETCGCDNNVDIESELPLTQCNQSCPDDDVRPCGGQDAYSVYIVKAPLPWFRGCFRTLDDLKSKASVVRSMTVTRCIQSCNDYYYAKIQDSNYCICDNEEPSDDQLAIPISCDKQCAGDPDKTCGGVDHIAVYLTCKQGTSNSISCSQLLQCDSSNYDMYGECHSCKPDYIGSYCFEKGFITIKTTTHSSKTTEIRSSSPIPPNATRPRDDHNFFEEIMNIKLKASLPFILPWISLLVFSILLYCTSVKSSETRSTLFPRRLSSRSQHSFDSATRLQKKPATPPPTVKVVKR